jgi:hypothetical protein
LEVAAVQVPSVLYLLLAVVTVQTSEETVKAGVVVAVRVLAVLGQELVLAEAQPPLVAMLIAYYLIH